MSNARPRPAPLSQSDSSRLVELYEQRLRDRAAASPSLLTKVGNFATAAVKHVAAGAPRCTEEEVAARHAICVGCEYFANSTCTKCGCPVSRERTYLGKLSWADQSCPVGKWGPIERPENKG